MFSIIQPLFLQKTKPLYPHPKHLFGIEFLRVSVIHDSMHLIYFTDMAQFVLKAPGLKEIVEIKFDNPLIHMYWNQR